MAEEKKRRPPLGCLAGKVTEAFDPKHLNFAELCAKNYPGRQWKDLSHRERTELIRNHLQPTHFLISPSSEHMWCWDAMQGLAMLFTGLITPFEVCFMRTAQPTDALFITNRLVDLLFIIDMALNFFLKIEVKGPHCSFKVIRDPWTIRRQYLRSWFIVDFVSVLPFDVVLIRFQNSGLTGIKFLRCVRLLRLVKVLRLMRTSQLIGRWRDHFGVTFAKQRLIKFSFVLFLSSHWMACLWGIVGQVVGGDLCSPDGKRLDLPNGLPLHEISWVTTLFLGGKDTPDSPCDPVDVYAASLHWSVMTITSIGYGDIVPLRYEEYWVCILCMMVGGLTWAYIIGSICGILASNGPVEERFEENMDNLNCMMRDAHVEVHERQKYREFLREAKIFDNLTEFRGVAKHFSPLPKGELLIHVTRIKLQSLHYLRDAPTPLLVTLIDKLELRFYARSEGLHHLSDYLGAIERGTIARGGKILMVGDLFGTDFIVSKLGLRDYALSIALSYALVQILHREDFLRVLDVYPDHKARVRRFAHYLAFKRAVLLCAKHWRRARTGANLGDNDELWLSKVFTKLDLDCPHDLSKEVVVTRMVSVSEESLGFQKAAPRVSVVSTPPVWEDDEAEQENSFELPEEGPPAAQPRASAPILPHDVGKLSPALPSNGAATALSLQRLDALSTGLAAAMEEVQVLRAELLKREGAARDASRDSRTAKARVSLDK